MGTGWVAIKISRRNYKELQELKQALQFSSVNAVIGYLIFHYYETGGA